MDVAVLVPDCRVHRYSSCTYIVVPTTGVRLVFQNSDPNTTFVIGVARAQNDIDPDEEMIVSEDQGLVETEGDESTLEDLEPTDADTYLLFTKPVFEEKASIGKLQTFYQLFSTRLNA